MTVSSFSVLLAYMSHPFGTNTPNTHWSNTPDMISTTGDQDMDALFLYLAPEVAVKVLILQTARGTAE